jgi:hypothetical protein
MTTTNLFHFFPRDLSIIINDDDLSSKAVADINTLIFVLILCRYVVY